MHRTRDGRRSGRVAAVAALVAVLVSACGDGGPSTTDPAAAPRGAPAGTSGPSTEPSGTPPAVAAPPPEHTPEHTPAPSPTPSPTLPSELADPVTVAVPSAGIDASVVPLSVDGDNVLVPPPYGEAGWWRAGPEPGEHGAAVIAGHLDSRDGPDVFYRLGDVAPGDQVVVTHADGATSTFQVVDVGQYSQDDFPTEAVYGGPDDRPSLRLITCGGEYDRELGRYRDNVVVFAEPA